MRCVQHAQYGPGGDVWIEYEWWASDNYIRVWVLVHLRDRESEDWDGVNVGKYSSIRKKEQPGLHEFFFKAFSVYRFIYLVFIGYLPWELWIFQEV